MTLYEMLQRQRPNIKAFSLMKWIVVCPTQRLVFAEVKWRFFLDALALYELSLFMQFFFFNLLANYWLYSWPVFSMRRRFVVKLSLTFESQRRGNDRKREEENVEVSETDMTKRKVFRQKVFVIWKFSLITLSCVFVWFFCFILLRLAIQNILVFFSLNMNKISKKNREKKKLNSYDEWKITWENHKLLHETKLLSTRYAHSLLFFFSFLHVEMRE